jgi:MAF protein
MIAQADRPVNATILLASASPRRRELIKLLGLPVEATSADIDETPLENEGAAELAKRLSFEKAQAVRSTLSNLQSEICIIIASDTVVSLDGESLGKPSDVAEARSMLQRLRNRSHQVFTAITLIDTQANRALTDLSSTDVPMRDYSDAEIETYIASGDPFDKAGAYAIQHEDFQPVERLTGCYANVMGLPLCHVVRSLRALDIEPPNNVPLTCQSYLKYECPVFEKVLLHDA